MSTLTGRYIHITGIVQGVGFRPFVYKTAQFYRLTGWVKNTSAGVEIVINGDEKNVSLFIDTLINDPPPLAHIDHIDIRSIEPDHYSDFSIDSSEDIASAFIPISPDISICDDCLRELFDPKDRRFLYPFINCTNCGPRFTIIKNIPYDRPYTTMAGFPLCDDCREEYHNPIDRRFHAQPVACSVCGPKVWLQVSGELMEYIPEERDDTAAIHRCQQLILQGNIVAIKGIGGFHLACDAMNPASVQKLRERKKRVDKPFAVMMPDIDTVMRHCVTTEADIELLISRERPIVILPKKEDSCIDENIAPEQQTIGVMLPYSPLHYMLFYQFDNLQKVPEAIVLTSGNLSEEPIAIDNLQALQSLSGLADYFLLSNRPIHIRCDDSVVRTVDLAPGKPTIYPIRRSRGYAPNPVRLPWKSPELLAVGAELKNTFCLTRENYAFISHHIGDLENYEAFQSFTDGITHFEEIFRINPKAIVYDIHPDYLSTKYALERAENEGKILIPTQHHHAHIAGCLADNNLNDETVIGVSFDGTGYGDDGAIWGGEFLVANYREYTRAAYLNYFPLPGGDYAIKHPSRIALAYLYQAGIDTDIEIPLLRDICVNEKQLISNLIKQKINIVNTSSMGRLFDLIAALIGIRYTINYEAQAAIELESIADPDISDLYAYKLLISEDEGRLSPMRIDFTSLIENVITDICTNTSKSVISSKFHNTVADIVCNVCNHLRNRFQIDTVALSGGVWQNITLLKKSYARLTEDKFRVLVHTRVPPNDGGISLGQAAIGAHILDNL